MAKDPRWEDLSETERARRLRIIETSDPDEAERSLLEALEADEKQRLISAAADRGIDFDPENELAFWKAVALRAVRDGWPDFAGTRPGNTRWDDERYAQLAADLYYEQRRYSGSKRTIAELFAQRGGPYASRWGAFTAATLRERIRKAEQSHLVRTALANPPHKLGDPDPVDALIRRYALSGNETKE